MSATELIEQLKALPANERKAFDRLFREMETRAASAASNGNGASPRQWPDFGARLKGIYGDTVAADSEAVVAYARGEW